MFIAAPDGLIFQQITLDHPDFNAAALVHVRRFLKYSSAKTTVSHLRGGS